MIKDLDIRSFKGLESVELKDCGKLNALIGKNNSGKSSVLHALDMAGLALSVRNWNAFQPKLEIKDLFGEAGKFEINIVYDDDRKIRIKTHDPDFNPIIEPPPDEAQRFKSVLILPDPGLGLARREHRTPKWILDQLEARNYGEINSLQILHAVKYYADHDLRGFKKADYDDLVTEVLRYFPELEDVESDITEHSIPTLNYKEYGRKLDILYSGTGLRHFLDILLKTTMSRAQVVLLDEPELGLHPDLQRRFIEYLRKLADEKNLQFFLATHSQVLLNYADTMTFFRITNTKGKRVTSKVPNEGIHVLMSDLGIRPSDVFNQDLCLLVEGSTDVVFFEHVIRTLYKKEFEKVAVGVIQYGGGSASGIANGTIDVSNIVPAQKYTFWTHDRDAKPTDPPAADAKAFSDKLASIGLECRIWSKRSIEWYFPEQIHVEAQNGDGAKETATRAILNGDQSKSYRDAAAPHAVCTPRGKKLRQLLQKHLTDKNQLDKEIQAIVEKLITWKKEIFAE
jgi:ABC-type cobalamin/Fe3+-siderophores transport system ATPase subunit